MRNIMLCGMGRMSNSASSSKAFREFMAASSRYSIAAFWKSSGALDGVASSTVCAVGRTMISVMLVLFWL